MRKNEQVPDCQGVGYGSETLREAEQRLDAELFLNEYPRWELGAPHQSIILHKMFLHATK